MPCLTCLNKRVLYHCHTAMSDSSKNQVWRQKSWKYPGPEKLVAWTPRSSIFSLRWKFTKSVCAHTWWASQLKKLLRRTYTYNIQWLYGAIHFSAFGNCIHSFRYGIVCLHVFHFFSDSHNAYRVYGISA